MSSRPQTTNPFRAAMSAWPVCDWVYSTYMHFIWKLCSFVRSFVRTHTNHTSPPTFRCCHITHPQQRFDVEVLLNIIFYIGPCAVFSVARSVHLKLSEREKANDNATRTFSSLFGFIAITNGVIFTTVRYNTIIGPVGATTMNCALKLQNTHIR